MNFYTAIKQNLENDEPNAPVYGKNGYRGEIDGSHTVHSGEYTTTKILPLKNIEIPKGWRMNWARKKRCVFEGVYYEFSLYSYSDWERESLAPTNSALKKLGVEAG
jgi:hypothetical protein